MPNTPKPIVDLCAWWCANKPVYGHDNHLKCYVNCSHRLTKLTTPPTKPEPSGVCYPASRQCSLPGVCCPIGATCKDNVCYPNTLTSAPVPWQPSSPPPPPPRRQRGQFQQAQQFAPMISPTVLRSPFVYR